MDKLFRITIYLLIFFVISVAIYFYSWWSFKPEEKQELQDHNQIYTMI